MGLLPVLVDGLGRGLGEAAFLALGDGLGAVAVLVLGGGLGAEGAAEGGGRRGGVAERWGRQVVGADRRGTEILLGTAKMISSFVAAVAFFFLRLGLALGAASSSSVEALLQQQPIRILS